MSARPLTFFGGNKLAPPDNRTSGKVGNYFMHCRKKRTHCWLWKQGGWVPSPLIKFRDSHRAMKMAASISRLDHKKIIKTLSFFFFF